MEKIDWQARFQDAGALWKHDGNLKRPFAQLVGGKISNFYFNGSKIAERQFLLEYVIDELVSRAPPELISVPLGKRPDVVFGPALGSVFLVYELARHLSWAWSTEKGENGKHILSRFSYQRELQYAVAIEDVITTGESVLASIEAVESSTSLTILPFVLCLVNRSKKKKLPDGRHIVSVLEVKDAKEWKAGKNPFTRDGKEQVPPVSPKKKWKVLTKKC